MRINPPNLKRAVTLIELLCVLGIIAILLACYLPAIARAFAHAKHVLFGFK